MNVEDLKLAIAIPASVSFIICFLTLWVATRRAEADLHTEKLEYLYVSVVELRMHNAEWRALVAGINEDAPKGNLGSFEKLASVTNKCVTKEREILMLIHLYFPRLIPKVNRLLELQAQRTEFIVKFYNEHKEGKSLSDTVSERMTLILQSTNKEIIKNAGLLSKRKLVALHYWRVGGQQTPGVNAAG